MNRVFAAVASTLLSCTCVYLTAQVPIPGKPQINTGPTSDHQAQSGSDQRFAPDAEEELGKGTALTRRGLFDEAVPHLLAARGRVADEYAASFNLALCYVGTIQFKKAIQILNDLRIGGHDRVEVENLLTQAYIGNAQPQEALISLQKAAALSPRDEKLYSFVADACMDHKNYSLGLEVVGIGLQNLPKSARLHYERAMFLTQLDQFDQAKPDFESATTLSAGSEIGYLASAHEKLFEGNIAEAARIAREGVRKGYENHALLTVLAEALIRSGVSPGQPDFIEAQTVLEKVVTQYPNDPASQISLGSLYLMAGRLEDAIVHLEKANQLEPDDPSVYAKLAKAYQRHGDISQAQMALSALAEINQRQAEKIGSSPGDHKAGYENETVK